MNTTLTEGGKTPPPAHAPLLRACRALWRATLPLMTAFVHEHGRSARLLLARRIARNLQALARAGEALMLSCREALAHLALRWRRISERLATGSPLAGRRPRRRPPPLGRPL